MFITDDMRKKLHELEDEYQRARGDSLRNKRTQEAKKALEDYREECKRYHDKQLRDFNRILNGY